LCQSFDKVAALAVFAEALPAIFRNFEENFCKKFWLGYSKGKTNLMRKRVFLVEDHRCSEETPLCPLFAQNTRGFHCYR
jgi:hypothetical protein